MTGCPTFVPLRLCEWIAALPVQQITTQQIVAFVFGALVVVIFSIDHYKVPTYAKTMIGEFIELAPGSLTSHSRYMKGLITYVGLMLGFYLVLLIIGPTAIAPILSFAGGRQSPPVDPTVWPLAATSIITLIGSRDDDKYLGRMEGWLRSLSHEVAYIPYAVTTLSGALDGSFLLTEDDLSAAGMLTTENQERLRESQEGSRQNWIRAKYLYSRLEQLREDDQFRMLMRTAENDRAFNFVREQKDILSKELDSDTPGDVVAGKIDAFKNAVAVFLASLLWSGCDNENAVNTKLARLRLSVSAPEPQSQATFMFHMLIYLSLAAALLKLLIVSKEMMGSHEGSLTLRWHLTLGFLVFLSTTFFVTRWREKKLVAGEWKYKSDAILRGSVLCVIAIAIVSTLVTFAWHQGGVGVFYAMLFVAFGMALPAALLFQRLMRWAASSPPTDDAVAAKVASTTQRSVLIKTVVRAGLMYAVVAFLTIVGPLYWFAEYVIVAVSPQQIVESASSALKDIGNSYGNRSPDDKWFTDVVPLAAIHKLDAALTEARNDVGSGNFRTTTMPAVLMACYELGRVSGVELFEHDCENNNLQSVSQKGNVLNTLYVLQGNVERLKPQYEALQNYNLWTTIQKDWRSALFAAFNWAVLAAVFAVSILLYRRQDLWDGLTVRKLPDFVPNLAENRNVWLRQPLFDMGRLSPLEALRYPIFRARLADIMNAQSGEPRAAAQLRIVA